MQTNYKNTTLTSEQKWISLGIDLGYCAITTSASILYGTVVVQNAVLFGTAVTSACGPVLGIVAMGLVVGVGVVTFDTLVEITDELVGNWKEGLFSS